MTKKLSSSLFRISLGGGVGLLGGPWSPLLAASRQPGAAETIGGEPPAFVYVLPYPTWELEDITLETGTASQEQVLADITKRRIDLHFDYHHQSLYAAEKGYVADAAGWMPYTSFLADARGVGAKVLWVEDGAERIRTGKMRYFSPVVLYDEKTLTVTALLSVALTNTPRSNNQAPLTATLAASSQIITRRQIAASLSTGGTMEKWVSILINFLDSLWCHSAAELLQHIDTARAKFVEVMGDGSEATAAASAEFTKKLPANATILQALIAGGLKIPDDAVKQLAAASITAASADVTDLAPIVGLPKTTSRQELAAHLVGLVTTMVPRAELDKLEAAREKNRVDSLLTLYADRFMPVEEKQLRELAAANYDAVEINLRSRQPLVRASRAASAPTLEQQAPIVAAEADAVETRMSFNGEERVVSEDGLESFTATCAILAEKGWGKGRYAEANRIRIEREQNASPAAK